MREDVSLGWIMCEDAEARLGGACGWLGLLRKGLSNQVGVNFAIAELREVFCSRGRFSSSEGAVALELLCERDDRADKIEDCEGDELRTPPVITADNLCS